MGTPSTSIFFTLSRKSNLVVTGNKKFDSEKQLCGSDVVLGTKGMLVHFRWSKTNQFGSRVLESPILAIPHSCLCPVRAFRDMVQAVPAIPSDPAFVLPRNGKTGPVMYAILQKFIKDKVAKLGLDPRHFSSHSLRRAGATWAFKAQVPSELIKVQGDWPSNAYLRYLEISLQQRMEVAQGMVSEIRKLGF